MIRDDINKMIMSAVKDHDNDRAKVYRLIKSEFLKYMTSKNAKPIDDSIEISIFQKMIKQREESVKEYLNGNRKDLADSEQIEIDIIKEFLPAIPTKNDIENYINTNYPNKIEKKMMGVVVKEIKEKLVGADGKLVADVVKENLI